MYKSNLDNVLNMFKKNINSAMEDCGKAGVENIKINTPVDTGDLRENNKYERQSMDSVTFVNDKDYAAAVEFGTYKMSAQSYFRKGLVNSLSIFKGIIYKEMKL